MLLYLIDRESAEQRPAQLTIEGEDFGLGPEAQKAQCVHRLLRYFRQNVGVGG